MIWWVVVGIYMGLLGGVMALGVVPAVPTVSVWDAQDTETMVRWGWQLVLGGVLQVAAAGVLGWLVGMAVWRVRGKNVEDEGHESKGGGKRNGHWVVAVAVGLVLTTGLVGLSMLRWPTLARLVVPWGGCLLGLWGAGWWRGGWLGRAALGVQIAVLGVVVVGAGIWGMGRALESQPADIDAAKVTSADKRRIVQVLRSGGERDEATRTVELTQEDVNVLLSWGLSVGSGGRKAAAELGDGSVQGRVSVAVPWVGGQKAYVNALVDGRVNVTDGKVKLRFDRVRVGRLNVPRVVLAWVAGAIVDTLRNDPDLGVLVRATRQLTIQPGRVKVVAVRGVARDHLAARALARLGAKPDVAEATGAYVRRLVTAAPDLKPGDEQFAGFVRAAFELAQERSAAAGADPVVENRAALLGLGIVLGHPRVERLVGDVTDDAVRAQVYRINGRVPLRGRRDWTQHFWVSAAIALMSNDAVSDAVGVLKEELDAGGGSGFSFSDLLADMCGTRLAVYVTRDAGGAREAQRRLGKIQVEELFPEAADLPEGIEDARLQAEYGGVGGTRYEEMIGELERRVESLWYGGDGGRGRGDSEK